MTTHVTSVELDKNRHLKYHLIQTENAFSLVASMEIRGQERKRDERESSNTNRKLILFKNKQQTVLQRHSLT